MRLVLAEGSCIHSKRREEAALGTHSWKRPLNGRWVSPSSCSIRLDRTEVDVFASILPFGANPMNLSFLDVGRAGGPLKFEVILEI